MNYGRGMPAVLCGLLLAGGWAGNAEALSVDSDRTLEVMGKAQSRVFSRRTNRTTPSVTCRLSGGCGA